MSKHTGTIVGAVLLVVVVVVVIATQSGHDGHRDVVLSIAAASPTTSVAPTPLPTPTPPPDPFAPARWAAANVAVIFLMLAIAIGAPIGIALHHWHQAKLPTQDWRIPFRDPQFPYTLDAHVRTSFPPVPQTYSPSLHIRNDPAVEIEEPPSQLTGPLPGAEALIALPGLAYGVRLDNGEPLIDHEIRALLVGGQMGWGKSTFVALLAAQLHQMGSPPDSRRSACLQCGGPYRQNADLDRSGGGRAGAAHDIPQDRRGPRRT